MDDPLSPRPRSARGAAKPQANARFCAQCGARLEGDGANEAGERSHTAAQELSGLRLARSQRRFFGLAAPELVLGLALLALVLACYALVVREWLGGGVLAVGAGLLAWSSLVAASAQQEGRAARMAVRMSDGARDRTGYLRVVLSSWSHAGRETVRLRALQRRLRREQRTSMIALGEAVYRGEEEQAQELKAETLARGEQLEECGQRLRLAVEAARERVSRERATIQPTQAVVVKQSKR